MSCKLGPRNKRREDFFFLFWFCFFFLFVDKLQISVEEKCGRVGARKKGNGGGTVACRPPS